MRRTNWAPDRSSTGHKVGTPELQTPSPSEPRQVTISLAVVTAELRKVARHGLPATRQTIGENLPHLRNVVARANHPDDVFSRLDAFNALVARILRQMEDQELGGAARILFGLAEGSQGTNLTTRRQRCAELLGYDFDHFRKRIEPRILTKVTEAFYRDLLRYRRRTRTMATAYETGKPNPPLTDEDITPEEELISRIWQHLYEVRAEKIAALLSPDDKAAMRKHLAAAATASQQLQHLCQEYVETYGRQLLKNGQLEYAIEGLEKLVVWRTDRAYAPMTIAQRNPLSHND